MGRLCKVVALLLIWLVAGCERIQESPKEAVESGVEETPVLQPNVEPEVIVEEAVERSELEVLAATATKRGGIAPMLNDYSHGVVESGDVGALRAAIDQAQPGDVVVVPVGVYRDTGVIRLQNSGREEAAIMLRAAESGRAVFTGESALEITGHHWNVEGLLFDRAVFRDQQYISIIDVRGADGVRVTDCAFLSSGAPDVNYVPVVRWRDGASDGRVDHCTFVDSLNMTLQVRVGPSDADTADGIRIDHNHFRDILRRHSNGGEAIQIGSNPQKYGRFRAGAVVENNRFERVDGDGEVISNKSSGNVIRQNSFIGCGGALWLRGGQDCAVVGNLWRGGAAGIVAYGSGHSIRGNVIEGTHSYALIAEYGSDWETVSNAGLSFEALQDSRIEENAIICPVVRGLVYGAFRMDAKKAAERPIPPSRNVIRKNVITGQRGTLLIADDFGETDFQDNRIHLGGSAKAGSPVEGFRLVNAEQAVAVMPRVEEMPTSVVGASWFRGD